MIINFIWILLSFILPLIIYIIIGFFNNNLLTITNYTIMVLSLLSMSIYKKRPYSIIKMIFVFLFFFMGVIPINDYVNNVTYWGASKLETTTLIKTNIIIIIGIISLIVGSILGELLPQIKSKIFFQKKLNKLNFVILFLGSSFLILYSIDFNIYKLISRGTIEDLIPSSNSIAYQAFYSGVIRPFPFLLLLAYYEYFSFKREKYFTNKYISLNRITFYFVLFYAVIMVLPTSISRFQAAALYISLLILLTPLWNRQYVMILSIIISLLIIFPLLNIFRYFDPDNFKIQYSLDFLSEGHFDAYFNFAHVIKADIITYGEQLLTTLLFFIPRSIWETKSIGSGALLASEENFIFTNISMPYIGEGYINLGILGVIIFMLFLGAVASYLDKKYWKYDYARKISLYSLIYPLLIGLIFFIMRGDLLSSLSFTIAMIITLMIVNILLIKKSM